jgi:acyl carrier protein
VNGVSQMEELLSELKVRIVELLNLVDVRPDDIDEDDQLVGGKLGIDSIDLLEMVMMLEREYGITIDNKELGEKVFATLKTLAMHIEKNSSKVMSR